MAEETICIEACVGDIESVREAVTGGADRIELCDSLLEGGTTPSFGMIAEAIQITTGTATKLHVIIRPRPGNFCYSQHELNVMSRDIAMARALNVDGIVVGVLCPNNTIDFHNLDHFVHLAKDATSIPQPLLQQSTDLFQSMKVTFHRAFDVCQGDPVKLASKLADHRIDFILSSGKAPSAWEGRKVLQEMQRMLLEQRQFKGEQSEENGEDVRNIGRTNLRIIAGGGVGTSNVLVLHQQTGLSDFHAASSLQEEIIGEKSKSEVPMGASSSGREHIILRTSSTKIRDMRRELEKGNTF